MLRFTNSENFKDAYIEGTFEVNEREEYDEARIVIAHLNQETGPWADKTRRAIPGRRQTSRMSIVTSFEQMSFGVAVTPAAVNKERRSDHLLLEATLAGDEDAFAELVGRYKGQITSYIYRMTNDYDGAIDLAQETFVRVYRAADRYKSDFAFSTYIYKIATNLAISEIRKRKRRRLVSLTGFFQETENERDLEFNPPDHQPLQDVVLVDTERRAAVARAITTLPEKYRAPLVLRDVEGKPYDEISRILGTNEGTIKSRISRAPGLLKEKLIQYM